MGNDLRTQLECKALSERKLLPLRWDGIVLGWLQPLAWEQNLFKVPCWNLFLADAKVQNGFCHLGESLEGSRIRGLLWLRIASRHRGMIRRLSRQGFEPILEMSNQELKLTRKLPSIELPPFIEIRKAVSGDLPQLKRMAGSIFCYDRFHQDAWIASERANRAHREWVENAVLQKVADSMWVAVEGKRIVGFHALKGVETNKERVGLTVLMGVDPAYGGRGIGRALLIQGLNEMSRAGARKAWVRTEKSNKLANRLYGSLGFREKNRFWYLRKRIA